VYVSSSTISTAGKNSEPSVSDIWDIYPIYQTFRIDDLAAVSTGRPI
jgi:hypothetical protein